MKISKCGTTVGLIGPGTLAEAVLKCLSRLESGWGRIVVSGPRKDRLRRLEKQFTIETTNDNSACGISCDLLLLTVKPDSFPQVARDLYGKLSSKTIVISMMAGISTAAVSQSIGHDRVVRAMPNLAVQVGEGAIVWCAPKAIPKSDLSNVSRLLECLGKEIEVSCEDYINMATAISGSGPAYIFLVMEALIDAAVQLGLPRELSGILVTQTLRGAVFYYEECEPNIHLSELRNRVTSPGGTTSHALYSLERDGLRTAFSNCVLAAYERSMQLASPKND